ncbi:MAG: hypothetical protein ACI8TP_004274 [Acidimicrobiales bacterium]
MSTDTAEPSDGPPLEELYTASYYASNLGIPYERNDHWLTFFGKVGDRIVSSIAPQTALDVGCAFGFLVEALRDRRVEASGTDVSEYAISQVGGSAVGHCRVGSALEPIEGTYDLISCVEVVEHLVPDDGRRALENLTNATDRLLLSTTPHDHAEPTHVNVQPPEYWAEIMAELGFFRDVDHDASYLTPWAGLFVRSDKPVSYLVKDYERSNVRLREEAVALRNAVLEQHARIDLLESSGDANPTLRRVNELETQMGEVKTAAAAREAQLNRDVLIARDTAVAAEASRAAIVSRLRTVEAELGAARYHQEAWDTLIEQLETGNSEALTEELAKARQRVHDLETSTTWKVGRGVMAPYRRLTDRA